MSNKDVSQAGVLRQRLVQRHDRAAGDAEDGVHTLVQEGLAYHLSTVQLHHYLSRGR